MVQSGPWYGPWLPVGAVLLSTAVAAGVALYSISEQRKIARKRATLDMLAKKEWDADYIAARSEFNKLRDGETPLEFWVSPGQRGSPQATVIRNTLNDYELIAVGIREGILDEDLYLRWFRASFLKDWRAARGCVDAIRTQAKSDRIFVEMQWLAEKWDPQLKLPTATQGPGTRASASRPDRA